MATDVVVPNLGESITEGTITTWLVEVGEAVDIDQPLLELETDKVTAELPAPIAGVLVEKKFADGDDVNVGAVVGVLDATAAATTEPAKAAPAKAAPEPVAEMPPQSAHAPPARPDDAPKMMPAAQYLAKELGLDPASIAGSGKGGRITKGDVLAASAVEEAPSSTLASMTAVNLDLPSLHASEPAVKASVPAGRAERRVKMTRMRRAIATRLKEVQNTAAILTTFNEVDMSAVMALRSEFKEAFLKRHEVKLGFMSFFVKAAVEALKEFPAVNGRIDGTDIIYNDFYDVGVAVSSDRGLVVPVIRDADHLSFAEVEKTINALAVAARGGSLTLSQLQGGTFSITNGGIFGSMLSTPIINAPQSAILGMHNIVQRPVAVDGQVVIRPVMYLALSYDHRIVDGSQAVRFLVKVKGLLENPSRLLLEV
jgi:2-oxoglutarate dehydrogenase E2 component (dihydrolipoamide succinyltransferase)